MVREGYGRQERTTRYMGTEKIDQTRWVREIFLVSCSSGGAIKAPRYSPPRIGQKDILFMGCLTYLTYVKDAWGGPMHRGSVHAIKRVSHRFNKIHGEPETLISRRSK